MLRSRLYRSRRNQRSCLNRHRCPGYAADRQGCIEDSRGRAADRQGRASARARGLLPEEAVQRYNAELQTSGKLSEASYAELEQRGFPRGMVDSYVRGILAQQQDAYAAAYEVTGGKEQYDAMIDWATRTLTPEQKNTFNNLLGSADGLTRKMGVEKLNEMYKQAIPQSPQQQLTGSTGSAVPGDIYASRAEMAADMAKADYWKNPAEQRRVAEKIQRSLSSGVKLG